MENIIFEFGICVLEDIIVFSFFNSLFKKRFNIILPVIAVVVTCTIMNFICSSLNIVLKTVIGVIMFTAGSMFLYKDKILIKTAYALVAMYVLQIVDIICGIIVSIITDNNIMELLFSEFITRIAVSIPIKLISALFFVLIYNFLSKIDPMLNSKFWVLFNIIIAVFLLTSTLFLQIYLGGTQGDMDKVVYLVIAILFFSMSLIVIYFFTEISRGFRRDSKLFLLESNYNSLQEQIEIQRRNDESTRKFRHDMHNHFSNVKALIDRGETASAVRLLDRAEEVVENISQNKAVNTGNKIVDAILLSKSAVCSSKNIVFEYNIEPLGDIKIDVVDLSSLISNLLDNAIEAAKKTDEPFVSINILKYNAYYTICVENSYSGRENLNYSEDTLFSTKPRNGLHGYGTQIINEISQKYSGNFSWEMGENSFIATVLLKA